MIHYVNGFMFNCDMTQIMLIKKNKPDWQKDKYNGIGGKVEIYENPEECMIREFKEETGIDTFKGEWKHFLDLTVPKHDGFVQFYYMKAPVEYLCDYINTETETVISDEGEVKPMYVGYCLNHYNDYNDYNDYRVIPNLQWLIPIAIQHETMGKFRLPICIVEE